METKKEIFVLSGAGHKGSVKISSFEEDKTHVKVECNLDFRPTGATLYIVGDEIAKTALYDSKTSVELPFVSNSVQGCVVRTSAITMFGGRGNKAEMLAKIEGEKHQNTAFEKAKIAPENGITAGEKTGEKIAENQARNAYENEVKTARNSSASSPQNDNVSSLAKLLSETSNDAGILKYNGSNFYLAVKPQLDEMFVCYKQEESLNNAVENSAWVHVDAEDGYYVVGLLKDGDTPSYICYGVPSKDGEDVPPELKNVCVWLPVEDENVKGYWVIYQSAVDGEIIK